MMPRAELDRPSGACVARWRTVLIVMLQLTLLLTVAVGGVGAQQAQTGSITGRVTNAATGSALESVSLFFPQLEMGTLGRADGRYMLANIPVGTHEIAVERIGYRPERRTITIAAGQELSLDFALVEEAFALDEIVVTGLAAAARRREVGTSINTVTLEGAVQERALPNLEAALQASGPGVMSMVNQGQVGSSGKIQLRGPTTLSGNEPLVYVDGVRMSTRRIPTAQAFDGRNTRVSGFSWNDINMDDVERVEIIKGAAATALYGTEASSGVIQIFTKKGSQGTPQWTFTTSHGANFWPQLGSGINAHPTRNDIDVAAHVGQIQRYSAAVRGGMEGLNYHVSASGSNEEGIVRTQWTKHWTATANLGIDLFPGATLDLTNTYTWRNTRQVADGNNRYGYLLNVLRSGKGYKPDDRLHDWVLEQEYFNTTDTYIGGAGLTYAHGTFRHNLRLGLHLVNAENTGTQHWQFLLAPQGTIRNNHATDRSLTSEYIGTLETGLPGTETLRSRLSWGAQIYDEQRVSTAAVGQNFPGPGDHTVSSAAVTTGDESRIRQVNAGFFFQEMVSFRDLLFLTGALRFDGTSTFGENYGFQSYPKASVSFVASDLPGWPTSVLPSLRLRAAVGVAGQAPGTFDANRTWDPIPSRGGTEAAVTPGNLGNPELGPERTREYELGFDGEVLAGRVGVEFTYYDARTNGALVNVQTVPSTGFLSSQSRNVGVVGSSGIELSTRVALIERENLSWGANFVLTTINSEAEDLGEAQSLSAGALQRIAVGYPMPSFFARRVTNPNELANPVYSDPEFIGSTFADRLMNLSSEVRVGGVSLSALGEWNLGGHNVNSTAWLNAQREVWAPCFDAQELNRTGRRDEIRAIDRARCLTGSSSAEFIEDASFFKLRNVTLSFRVPERFLGPVSSGTFSVSGQNLWVHTKYTGTDPEVHEGGGDNDTREDYYSMPPRRAIVARLAVTF
jgi:TonB-dependent SusC/RagA subfamily outer membrane receptor